MFNLVTDCAPLKCSGYRFIFSREASLATLVSHQKYHLQVHSQQPVMHIKEFIRLANMKRRKILAKQGLQSVES